MRSEYDQNIFSACYIKSQRINQKFIIKSKICHYVVKGVWKDKFMKSRTFHCRWVKLDTDYYVIAGQTGNTPVMRKSRDI